MSSMDRIAVVGSAGAGKSTLSRRLGPLLDIPVVHLDEHYWHPGWVGTPRDEWRVLQAEMVAAERWIIDGNYGGTLDLRAATADTIVVLDYHRIRCLGRAVRRSALHLGTPTQAPGCPERFDPAFLRWIWNFPSEGRERVVAALRAHGRHADWVWLTSPARTEQWVWSLEQRHARR